MHTTANPLLGYVQSLVSGLPSAGPVFVRALGVAVFAGMVFVTRSAWAGPAVRGLAVKEPAGVVASYLRVAIATNARRDLPEGASAQAGSTYYATYRKMAPIILQTHALQTSREMALGGLASQFSEAQTERLEDAYIRLMIGKRVRLIVTQAWLGFEPAAWYRLDNDRVMIWVNVYLRDGAKQPIGFILQRQPEVSGFVWRIINTQPGHFSEVAEQRVRYRRLVQTGGPEALLSVLEQRLEKLK